jgi:hypothetical protein
MTHVSKLLAAALSDELRSRGIVDLGTPICEEIILNVFKVVADHANTRTMTEDEANAILKRST